jgi:hypothetical protein
VIYRVVVWGEDVIPVNKKTRRTLGPSTGERLGFVTTRFIAATGEAEARSLAIDMIRSELSELLGDALDQRISATLGTMEVSPMRPDDDRECPKGFTFYTEKGRVQTQE